MDGALHPLLMLVVFSAFSCADPNFKNIFKQTTKEAHNEALTEIAGSIPKWLTGDFVRQNCASFGEIDGEYHRATMLPNVIVNVQEDFGKI